MLAPKARMMCAEVCAHWRVVASDEQFQLKVLPIEAGASNKASGSLDTAKRGNQPNALFPSLSAAIAAAAPGDTICLCAGHFWEESVVINMPLKIIGCIEEPNKCALEITGQIRICSNVRSVVFAGITISRPRKILQAKALIVTEEAGLDVSLILLNFFII